MNVASMVGRADGVIMSSSICEAAGADAGIRKDMP
jgi:hypothetical protein